MTRWKKKIGCWEHASRHIGGFAVRSTSRTNSQWRRMREGHSFKLAASCSGRASLSLSLSLSLFISLFFNPRQFNINIALAQETLRKKVSAESRDSARSYSRLPPVIAVPFQRISAMAKLASPPFSLSLSLSLSRSLSLSLSPSLFLFRHPRVEDRADARAKWRGGDACQPEV